MGLTLKIILTLIICVTTSHAAELDAAGETWLTSGWIFGDDLGRDLDWELRVIGRTLKPLRERKPLAWETWASASATFGAIKDTLAAPSGPVVVVTRMSGIENYSGSTDPQVQRILEGGEGNLAYNIAASSGAAINGAMLGASENLFKGELDNELACAQWFLETGWHARYDLDRKATNDFRSLITWHDIPSMDGVPVKPAEVIAVVNQVVKSHRDSRREALQRVQQQGQDTYAALYALYTHGGSPAERDFSLIETTALYALPKMLISIGKNVQQERAKLTDSGNITASNAKDPANCITIGSAQGKSLATDIRAALKWNRPPATIPKFEAFHDAGWTQNEQELLGMSLILSGYIQFVNDGRDGDYIPRSSPTGKETGANGGDPAAPEVTLQRKIWLSFHVMDDDLGVSWCVEAQKLCDASLKISMSHGAIWDIECDQLVNRCTALAQRIEMYRTAWTASVQGLAHSIYGAKGNLGKEFFYLVCSRAALAVQSCLKINQLLGQVFAEDLDLQYHNFSLIADQSWFLINPNVDPPTPPQISELLRPARCIVLSSATSIGSVRGEIQDVPTPERRRSDLSFSPAELMQDTFWDLANRQRLFPKLASNDYDYYFTGLAATIAQAAGLSQAMALAAVDVRMNLIGTCRSVYSPPGPKLKTLDDDE